MPISSSTLSAIQKVGAAAFAADDKLKKEVQSYAERVNMAMVKNPYNLGNDALIEAWKVVARLSKTMMGIEEELRNIHRIASELTQDDQPSVRDTPALAAPVAKAQKANKADATITTVKIKTKTRKTKAARTPAQAPALAGNSAKLMAQLQDALNGATFTTINQSALARAAGIPVGSMGATIGRLVKAGRIVSHANGSLKLTTPAAAAPSATKAEAQPSAAAPVKSTAQA